MKESSSFFAKMLSDVRSEEGVWGTEACRPLRGKQAGEASGIARSANRRDYASSPDEIPKQVLGQQP